MASSGVMSKNGDAITSYVYDDWNEYVMACILTKCNPCITYTPILSDDYKKTECKYEAIYKVLCDFCEFLCDPSRGINEKRNAFKSFKQFENDNMYYYIVERIASVGCISTVNIGRYDEMAKSALLFTENFENNPIKAYIRFSLIRFNSSYEWKKLISVYWIYAFAYPDLFGTECTSLIPYEKVDVKKCMKYMCLGNPSGRTVQFNTGHVEFLVKCIEYREEQHQKEIEELLAPGGAGYLAAKERFEKLSNDGLN